MEKEEPQQPSKCFFNVWQQHQTDFLAMSDQPHKFDVQLCVNFVVEYLPHHYNMNVCSEKIRVLLDYEDLVDNLKVCETMLTMFKCTAPVTKSDLVRIVKIVSSKAKMMDADPHNVGRDVISIIMSLRIVYLKDYKEEVELSRAARLGREGSESLKKHIPALYYAVFGLEKVVYDKDSCLEELCSIYLVGFDANEEIRQTSYMHDFHRTCIAKWMKMSHLCPLYRFSLLVYKNTETLCLFK